MSTAIVLDAGPLGPADPKELDADVILAPQVLTQLAGTNAVVATTNPGHLSLFVSAQDWRKL